MNHTNLGEGAAGCTLPVEMFFPSREFPTPALEAGLAQQGVACRALPPLQPADLPLTNATDTETDLSGFTMKIAALILSRFQEVGSFACIVCSDINVAYTSSESVAGFLNVLQPLFSADFLEVIAVWGVGQACTM